MAKSAQEVSQRVGQKVGWVKAVSVLSVLTAVSLGSGVYLGVQTRRLREDPLEKLRLRDVSAQSRILADSFAASLQALRAQALLSSQTLSHPPSDSILLWAKVGLAAKPELHEFQVNPKWTQIFAQTDDLSTLISGLNVQELAVHGVSLLHLSGGTGSRSELLGFAFKVPEGALVVVANVDEAFPAFRKFQSGSDEGEHRAFLISNNGYVFAHSRPSYVGSNFSGTALFRDSIHAVLTGPDLPEAPRSGISGKYQSIDRLPVAAGVTRVGSLPLGVVIEQVISLPAPLGAAATLSWLKSMANQLLSVLSALAVLILGCAAVLRRGRELERVQDDMAKTLPPSFSEELQKAQEIKVDSKEVLLAKAMEDFDRAAVAEAASRVERQARSEALLRAQKESQLIREFENQAASLKDAKQIAHRLTSVATQLCDSPTLFFTFHDKLKAAILQADAGFAAADSPIGMSFQVDPALISALQISEQNGEAHSLANYPPLAKILLNRMGVAHFEAWAVTGCGPLGRQAGRARLLGVLVILQAGTESASRRDSLNRMMKTTGLAYENALQSKQI